MAPPMKELPRWLLDNPEFSVAPDWTDIVKQSVSNPDKTYEELHCCTTLLINSPAPVLLNNWLFTNKSCCIIVVL